MPDFTYDAKSGRYRRRGRFVSQADVLAAVDGYLDGVGTHRADVLFEMLRAGQVDVREFQLVGEREIAKAHVAAATVAKGGRAQMSQADYGRVGGTVKEELKHWRDLCRDIAQGKPLDGRVRQSLNNYIRAAATSAQRVQGAEMEARGFTEWINVLGDAVHCKGNGSRPSCPSLSRQWRPLKERVLRGARSCWWNCRCRDKFRNPATGEVRN